MFLKNKSEDAANANLPSLSVDEGNANHNDDSVLADLDIIGEDEEAHGGGQAGAGTNSLLARRQQSGGGKHAPRLSVVSNKFDIGQKGYLTEAEQSARRLASQSGLVSIEDVVKLKEEQRAMSQKISSLARRNIIMIILLIISTLALGLTNMKGQDGTRVQTERVVREANVDTQELIKGVSDTAVITDGNGDYLLAFKGHEDEDNAGVSTRAYGDHFTSNAKLVDGAFIQCLPIAEVARMVSNLVDGVSTHLVMTNEDGLETDILPTDGDFEDQGATLSFGGHFYAFLDSDACYEDTVTENEEGTTGGDEAVGEGGGEDRNLRSSARGNAAMSPLIPSSTSTSSKPTSRAAVLQHHREQFILAREAIKQGRKLYDGKNDTYAEVPVPVAKAKAQCFTDEITYDKAADLYCTDYWKESDLASMYGADTKAWCFDGVKPGSEWSKESSLNCTFVRM